MLKTCLLARVRAVEQVAYERHAMTGTVGSERENFEVGFLFEGD